MGILCKVVDKDNVYKYYYFIFIYFGSIYLFFFVIFIIFVVFYVFIVLRLKWVFKLIGIENEFFVNELNSNFDVIEIVLNRGV